MNNFNVLISFTRKKKLHNSHLVFCPPNSNVTIQLQNPRLHIWLIWREPWRLDQHRIKKTRNKNMILIFRIGKTASSSTQTSRSKNFFTKQRKMILKVITSTLFSIRIAKDSTELQSKTVLRIRAYISYHRPFATLSRTWFARRSAIAPNWMNWFCLFE